MKRYDRCLEKVVEVCCNYDGPILSVEKKGGELNSFSLQRGRRFLFDGGMLYAYLFHNQLHSVDLLTRQVRVYPITDTCRLLTALTYAQRDYTFDHAIWRPGFLLYDSATHSLVVSAASEHSRELKLQEIAIPFSIIENECLPRDVYNCNILDFGDQGSFLIF